MIWICKRAFTCYPGDVETRFHPGDTIPDDVAMFCGLAGKPDLAEETAPEVQP